MTDLNYLAVVVGRIEAVESAPTETRAAATAVR